MAISTTNNTPLHSTPLHLQLQLQLHTLHYTKYITLHYTTLHYTTLTTATATTTTTLLYTTLQYTTLITLRYTKSTLHSTTLHYTPLRSTTLHYTRLHYTTLQLQLQLQLQPHYITLHYTRLHYIHYPTLHFTTLITAHKCNCNYTTLITPHHNYNSTTLQTTTTAALHHTTSSSCGWGDSNHCNHSKKHNSNYLAVHQWIRSAIRDSQQPTSPVGFLFLRLPLLYYWYLFTIQWEINTLNQVGTGSKLELWKRVLTPANPVCIHNPV